MSTRMTNLRRAGGDHFQPDDPVDAKAQRHLRAALEQIDYTAFHANKEVLGGSLRTIDVAQFQRLALGVAQARARWTATALAMAEGVPTPDRAKVAELADLRAAYEELAQVYDGLRRMVERGYLAYTGA